MAMKRCEQGHYYDTDKHTSCPVCGVKIKIAPTKPAPAIDPKASDKPANVQLSPTKPVGQVSAGTAGRIEIAPTRPVRITRDQHSDPVVGWLVCVDGTDKGRDYRLHSDRNYIGRNPDMDVCIPGDTTVSGRNHVIISYNPRNGNFTLIPGEGRNIVYVNDDELLTPQVLQAYDRIEVGKTKLMFAPFCGDAFSWEEE